MAKPPRSKSKTAAKPSASKSSAATPALLQKHPVLVTSGIFLVLMLIFFFAAIFQEKTYATPDAQAAATITAPLDKILWQDRIYPQWMPYIFGGMPSFASLTYNPFAYFPDLPLYPLRRMLAYALHYVLAGLGVFLFLRRKGADYLPALLGGLAFMLTPYLITMTIFGHGSQMMTTVYLPLALWAVDRLLEKFSWLNLGLAGLIMGFMLQRGHVQIAYYGIMFTGLYVIYHVITALLRKESKKIAPMLGGYIGALVLALALSAMLYLPLQEYTSYSIRGSASVLQPTSGKADTGVGFDYATQWSFSVGEMMTFIIPSFYGFGGATYWGNMPFTDYPNYMGILVLGLAIVGLFKRVPQAGFFALTIVLALLISFGKHFDFFYRLFYDYFPYFNKFRVPVMILVLVQCSTAILAGLGLQALLQPLAAGEPREAEARARRALIAKRLWITAGLIFGVVLLFTIFRSGFQEFMSGIYPDRYELATQARLDERRVGMLLGDMWTIAGLAAIGLAMLALAYTHKISTKTAAAVFVLATLFDLWIVDKRIGNPPVSEASKRALLQADEVAQFLQKDPGLFRIYPTLDLFGEMRWAAQGIHSVGGYHAAKPRRYQDFLEATDLQSGLMNDYFEVVEQNGQRGLRPRADEAIPVARRNALKHWLDMLNVKYILSFFPLPEGNWVNRATVSFNYAGNNYPLMILENTTVLPRAFLVGNYEVHAENLPALNRLASGEFDPRHAVILAEAPGIAPQPDSTASAVIKEYHLHKIVIETASAFPQILVLSDTYYPTGWHAFVDGNPVKTHVANYCFRGVEVPAGKHQIEFRYASRAFATGVWLSLGALAVCLACITLARRRNNV